MLSAIVRFAAYPLVFGLCAAIILWILANSWPLWPAFALVAGGGIAAVALLERVQPYQREWLSDHDDLATDVLHALVNLGTLSGTAWALHALQIDFPDLWPVAWPNWVQVLLAGTVMDLGLYAMHRWSHRSGWLWRLHAPHHSSERLYWLNGERRHPLSAVLLAGPGLLAVLALGAPPMIISAWLTLLAVHLAFQHANLDYRVGPLRYVLGVAEIHRWHHKRDYEDAQVNFGEFWMLWDHLFGSFHDRRNGVAADEVGLRDREFPKDYLGQLGWPFRLAYASRSEEALRRARDPSV